MCSQPMVQAAHDWRATRRAAFSASPDSAAASSNVPCWKFRVGSAARRLKVSRLATVPSSRYFAVAGPNERCDRSRRRPRTTPPGRRPATRCEPRDGDRLQLLRPHDRAEPAAAGVAVVVADGGVADQVLAGRPDDRRVETSARAEPSAVPPRPVPAGPTGRRPAPADIGRRRSPAPTARAHAPTTTRASKPVFLAARAKCDDDSASLSRSVSGDLATTANLAEVVSGVPTSGLKAKTSGASGASGSTPAGASRCSRYAPSPTPPRNRRSTSARERCHWSAARRQIDAQIAAVVTEHHH